VPIGVVTNGSAKAQKAKITNSCLDRLIDVVVVSESFGVKKPSPELDVYAHD
jgi:FMN phosphatase YigB (HAD superfamily)